MQKLYSGGHAAATGQETAGLHNAKHVPSMDHGKLGSQHLLHCLLIPALALQRFAAYGHPFATFQANALRRALYRGRVGRLACLVFGPVPRSPVGATERLATAQAQVWVVAPVRASSWERRLVSPCSLWFQAAHTLVSHTLVFAGKVPIADITEDAAELQWLE